MKREPILPPATLGMLGGGQLGRMFTMAARTMGYRVIVLDPDPYSPAGAFADGHVQADYLDPAALDRLGRDCQAVSTEFENVPADALERLAGLCRVRPSADAVAPTQDRIAEKSFLDRHGLPTVAWAAVPDAAALAAAVQAVGTPALLKRARGGYDGKGQARLDDPEQAGAAFEALGGEPCVVEQCIELEREVSVIVARGADGGMASFPPGENVHRDGILFTTRVPAGIGEPAVREVVDLAAACAEALGYVGVLGVELFVGRDGVLRINELAPRPHNSGHYSLDACATTQFEQQVRMLCALPPGDTSLLSPVAMVNLLGDLWHGGEPDWTGVFDCPGACLHLYGKREPRSGRKMGHVNVLAGDAATALDRVGRLHARLARGGAGPTDGT